MCSSVTNRKISSSPNNRHEFGCCEEEDLEVLQLLYCRMMAENYTCKHTLNLFRTLAICLVEGEANFLVELGCDVALFLL